MQACLAAGARLVGIAIADELAFGENAHYGTPPAADRADHRADAGVAQVTLPLAAVGGCSMGLSLLGPPGGDAMLLAAAAKMQ